MRARSHFKDSKDPFALTAFGQNFYVITQVKQCAEVYKNSETLSFEGFVQDLMRTNGIKEYAIEVMYKKLPQDKSGFPNPKSESLGVLAQKMHIHQLHPMHDQLILIQKKVQDWINSNLVLEKIPGFSDGAVSVANDAKQVEVSLYHWSSDMFVQLGQDVYFGDTLGKDSPDAYKSFVVFDELIYKALYQYPGFLSKDMAAGRTGLVAAIEKYLRLPKEERRDAAWLISNFEDEMASIDIGVEDMAICIFHLYLAYVLFFQDSTAIFTDSIVASIQTPEKQFSGSSPSSSTTPIFWKFFERKQNRHSMAMSLWTVSISPINVPK
jgi:hypothetical protein